MGLALRRAGPLRPGGSLPSPPRLAAPDPTRVGRPHPRGPPPSPHLGRQEAAGASDPPRPQPALALALRLLRAPLAPRPHQEASPAPPSRPLGQALLAHR